MQLRCDCELGHQSIKLLVQVVDPCRLRSLSVMRSTTIKFGTPGETAYKFCNVERIPPNLDLAPCKSNGPKGCQEQEADRREDCQDELFELDYHHQ